MFRAAVPNLFGTRDRFRGRQFFHGRWGGDGSGGNASDGERQMKLCLLARPPLTSCCAAWFLTGCGPVLVHGPGVGGPWSRGSKVGLTPQLNCVTKDSVFSNSAFLGVSITSWLQDGCQQLLGLYSSLSMFKVRKQRHTEHLLLNQTKIQAKGDRTTVIG